MELIPDPSTFETPDYNGDTIKWDTLDQLWRFNTSGWGNGIRNYNLSQRSNSTRATSLNPEIVKMEIEPKKAKWNDFFENNTFGSLFAWIGEELGFDKKLYLLPRTISKSEAHYFLWKNSKFYDDNSGQVYGNDLKQAVHTSFLIIYWMGRTFNIF